MATNEGKTLVVNMAVSKTKAGYMSTGEAYSTGIDDTVFADFTTGSNETIKRAALYYESCVKRALKEIQPDFAKRYADLGNRITINKEYGEWEYLFELPDDFLQLIKQTSESNTSKKIESDILDFDSYAHTVTGDDDDVYVCTTSHTSADDTSDGQPSDNDGSGNWTLDSEDEYEGAEHEFDKSYTADTSGKLLVTNELSNDDGDSAYIEYIPYEQSGVNDDPTKYPDHFLSALSVLLASEIELDFDRRRELITEYRTLARPDAIAVGESDEYEESTTKVITARTNLRIG
jgi:hypothetical protein